MEAIFAAFKKYYPTFAKETCKHHAIGRSRLVCEQRNGDRVIFNAFDNSCRRYENNDGSEETWRKRFGHFLTDTLSERAMTQKDLSWVTGISEVTISKYINGSVTPTAYNLSKIAKALNCDFGDMVEYQ